MKEQLVFIRRISKTGSKMIITIPKELMNRIEHGKFYRVILEPLEDTPVETQK